MYDLMGGSWWVKRIWEDPEILVLSSYIAIPVTNDQIEDIKGVMELSF